MKTASAAEEGEWCEPINDGCMEIFDQIEKMEKRLKDTVRFLLDFDASSPHKYLSRGQKLVLAKNKSMLFSKGMLS